jgi:hypothetical protein
MKRNAEVGVFTKSSKILRLFNLNIGLPRPAGAGGRFFVFQPPLRFFRVGFLAYPLVMNNNS